MLFESIKKNEVLIYDNLLNSEEIKSIKENIFDPYFPWYLIQTKDEYDKFYSVDMDTYKKASKIKNVREYTKFVHTFLMDRNMSNKFSIAETIIRKIVDFFKMKKIKVLRVKTNLQTNNILINKNHHTSPHIDQDKKHMVGIYYVNDCDGDTRIFKKNKLFKSIKPKAGRMVLFNGALKHAAGFPVKSQVRCVINFNFEMPNV